MNYEFLCAQVREIALATGDFIRKERMGISHADIELKGTASLVTYVDKTAERMIVESLRKLLPEAGYVTEEGTAVSKGEELVWIIDPLDGTTNYLHGIFPASVSIGLVENGKPVMGVVYETGLDELFYAWRDSPAWMNGREIKVSLSSRSEDTLIATGFPYYDFERLEDYINVLRNLMKSTRGLRRMGSAAVDLCYVAAGRFDAFFEHALHAWDVAAGALIVRQAGGKVTDFNGGDNWLFGGEIIAASHHYFDEFFRIVHSNLGRIETVR